MSGLTIKIETNSIIRNIIYGLARQLRVTRTKVQDEIVFLVIRE